MGVLVTVNGIFFYLTIRRIYGQHRSIRSTINQDNAHQDTGASYQVYLRLFIVMGCNWILEFVSYICQIEEVAQDLLYVNEIINGCEGITIFLVTICSRKTIRETFESFQNRDRDGSSTEFSSHRDSSKVKK
ncbi:probable G-protein coupled receptor Mth-like 11 [Drosophila bipectinata]|uniref:probable G-protein coupled receptor Mth-like 11 n=1 Tax=Drosophila bipectinata TaxID=42026 RepID=UPI0038B2A3AA